MSRSKRKAIYKDSGVTTAEYWRTIRRIWKQKVDQFYKQENFMYWDFDDSLPNPKSLINDYDYCDYIVDYEYNGGWFSPDNGFHVEQRKLLRRK